MKHREQLPTTTTVPATKFWSPWRGAIAGLLVGAAIVGVLVAVDSGAAHDERAGASTTTARRFIDAWRRSQFATWKVDLRWTRETPHGKLEDVVRVAQRPPDRLSTGGGSVDTRRGDRALACATGEDAKLRCRDAGPAPPYTEEVARGTAVLEQQVLGPDRLYDVTLDGHCYRLQLRYQYPAPPLGIWSRFCFDEASSAPTLREIHRAEGLDSQQAIAVSGQVEDGDLAPPPAEAG